MKIVPGIIFLFVFNNILFPQISILKFLDEPFQYNAVTFTDSIKNKKLIVKEVLNHKAIIFYDWMEPLSIKVGYLFSEKDGRQVGKMIANGKDNEEDSKALFKKLKSIVIDRYGPVNSENNMFGISMLIWNLKNNITLMLTSNEDKTMLTLIKN